MNVFQIFQFLLYFQNIKLTNSSWISVSFK